MIIDPTVIPVLTDETQLAQSAFGQVAAERLSAAGLQAHFRRTEVNWTPERTGDRIDRPAGALKPASVLIPIIQRPSGLVVLLTERTGHLASHAGQISFPGGRAEPTDTHAIATALREAHEEVGLDPSEVEVVGLLPKYVTITGYEVTPVVGLIPPVFSSKHDPWEVAEVFEVPLDFLMNPKHHECRGEREIDGGRSFYAMPWRAQPADDKEYFIWGATAAMLRNLYRFLVA